MYWILLIAGFFSGRLMKSLGPQRLARPYVVGGSDILVSNMEDSHEKNKANEQPSEDEVNLEDLILGKENKKRRWLYARSGEDERNMSMYTPLPDPDLVLINITRFMFQMELLTLLENKDVGVLDKMRAISKYRLEPGVIDYRMKLKAGGLLDDWEAEI